MMSHKHKQKVAQKFYKRKQNANLSLYTQNQSNKFVHTELVQVFMIYIKWISSWVFGFENKHNKQSIKINHGTKKTYVKCNKTITALHFVQYDALWSTEKQY